MPAATVPRALTVGALTTAVTLSLTLQAAADAGDKDTVRVRLVGTTVHDPRSPSTRPDASRVSYLHLFNPKGKFVGDAGSRCDVVEADRDRLTTQCTRVLRLKNGEITLHDVITRQGNEPVTAKTAIAGGTGVYNDAEGEGYITLNGDRVLFDLHVDD
ncbi:hypothetical protein [Streptomyces sp. NPDC002851]